MNTKIPEKTKEEWREILRHIPVSVNNFYGDPLIQWNDTIEKLDRLLKSGHTGPVGIITKGKITDLHADKISKFRKQGLNIILLISISEMPQFEKIGMDHRYENIRLLNKYDIPNIAYIRPLTPPYNTDEKTIEKIFTKLYAMGAKAVVASGFRGDDAIVKDMSPDEKIQWVMRVKIMTKDVYGNLKKYSEKFGIKFFTRTACAVAWLSGDSTVYNPYYHSPNLVKCDELDCPLKNTCGKNIKPHNGALELVKFFGYDAVEISGCGKKCEVEADKRLECPSCCTTCYRLDVPRIYVKNKIGLGDLTFIRFLTGMLTMQPGLRDDGNKEVGYVRLPNFPDIDGMQCLNSWWPYAHVGDRCYDCAYCVEKYYGNCRKDFGFPPADLIDMIL